MKFTPLPIVLYAALIIAFLTPSAHAQRGDRGNQKQPEVWRDMDVPAAPVVPPDKAVDTFKIAPHFELQLVASDPMIHDPVAIDWDADGRIWVVEMRGYMPNVDGKGEGDAKIGRISVLEDTDGDGKMDKSTVFLDGLQMPRAIAVVEDSPGVKGVLVAEPSTLWFCRDTDGDLKCDEKTDAYQGYARQGPVEHTDNGLMWCIDNHRYNAKSSKRFRVTVTNGKIAIAEDQTLGRGQWGISQDNYGRLYHNTNSSYLHMDENPGAYYGRNKHADVRYGGGFRVRDQSVYSIRVNPGINRGYQKNMLREDGRQSRTTGVCGPGVYRGDQYPAEYVGDVFVPEPCANVVTLHDFVEKDGKIDAERRVYDDPKWGKREFLASVDERVRPVNTYTGPDGCMYVVDLYRGILQHKAYVTTFLRKQILERGLDKPTDLGRIYRIVYTGPGAKPPATTMPMLTRKSSAELVDVLAHANGWHRDNAQRLLVQRLDPSVVPALRKMATSHDDHLARLHALWTLIGMDMMDAETAIAAMGDKHPRVAVVGVRSAEPLLKKAEAIDVIERLKKVAMSGDEAVRTQVMLTLGETAGPRRDKAEEAMLDLLAAHGKDSGLRNAALSGLGDRELVFLQKALEHGEWSKSDGGKTEFIRDLSATIYRRHQPGEVAALLARAAVQPAESSWRAAAMLEGVVKSSKKPKPIELTEKPESIAMLNASKDKSIASHMKQVDDLIRWKGDSRKPVDSGSKLSEAEQKLAAEGKTFYMAVCMACHQPHGEGLTGLAPSLVDSPWVTGDKERLIRIALHGLQGPITVNDEEWNLVMPGHAPNPLLTDERMAGVLTYIRNEWDNEASAISPELVKKIRAMHDGRVEPWTVEELEELTKKK